jgi:hypothetical protein
MERLLRLIGVIFFIAVFFNSAFGVSYLEVICNIGEEKIYVDGKLKGVCKKGKVLDIPVLPGKHKMTVGDYIKNVEFVDGIWFVLKSLK